MCTAPAPCSYFAAASVPATRDCRADLQRSVKVPPGLGSGSRLRASTPSSLCFGLTVFEKLDRSLLKLWRDAAADTHARTSLPSALVTRVDSITCGTHRSDVGRPLARPHHGNIGAYRAQSSFGRGAKDRRLRRQCENRAMQPALALRPGPPSTAHEPRSSRRSASSYRTKPIPTFPPAARPEIELVIAAEWISRSSSLRSDAPTQFALESPRGKQPPPRLSFTLDLTELARRTGRAQAHLRSLVRLQQTSTD